MQAPKPKGFELVSNAAALEAGVTYLMELYGERFSLPPATLAAPTLAPLQDALIGATLPDPGPSFVNELDFDDLFEGLSNTDDGKSVGTDGLPYDIGSIIAK